MICFYYLGFPPILIENIPECFFYDFNQVDVTDCYIMGDFSLKMLKLYKQTKHSGGILCLFIIFMTEIIHFDYIIMYSIEVAVNMLKRKS